jgi:hypothetical protein
LLFVRFFEKARESDEAENFVFVQLSGHKPGAYNVKHTEYSRNGKIDFGWKLISLEMKKSSIYIFIYYERIISII